MPASSSISRLTHITDARGRTFRVTSTIPPNIRDAVDQSVLDAGMPRWLWWFSGLVLFAICLAEVWLMLSPWPGKIGGWIMFVFPIAAIVIGSVALLSLRERLHTRLTAAMLLASHHCPACGYDLCATLPEPDGCMLCPECAAAWRIDRQHPASRP